jgi:hypothetical protein
MRKFEIFGPPRYSWLPAASRCAVASVVIGTFLAAGLTAGPGNGYQPPREAVHVTLPTVVIVGHREAPQQLAAASSQRSLHTVSGSTIQSR